MKTDGVWREILVTLPKPTKDYTPKRVVFQLSRLDPFYFQVNLAGETMPDGRIRLRIALPPDTDSKYSLQVIDIGAEPSHELFGGKLSDIPKPKDVE
jgi:hypothetical protein